MWFSQVIPYLLENLFMFLTKMFQSTLFYQVQVTNYILLFHKGNQICLFEESKCLILMLNHWIWYKLW